MVVLSEETPEDFTPEKLSGAYRRLAAAVRDADRLERARPRRAVGARLPRGGGRAAALARPRGRDAAPPAGAQLRRRAARRLRHAGAGRRAGRAAGRRAGRSGPPRPRSRRRCGPTCARRARRRRRRARRTTSSAGRTRSAATPARPTSCCATRTPPADWPTARRVDLPGFRPVEAYEAAIANLAPELTRRPDPETVARGARVGRHAAGDRRGRRRDATARSRTCAASSPAARASTPVGVDGYWSLTLTRSFRFMR